MSAARTRRLIVIAGAALLSGAALFFILKPPGGEKTRTADDTATAPGGRMDQAPPVLPAPAAFTPPLRVEEAGGMSTADIALQLAGWPEGRVHPDLPRWAEFLAARGPSAVRDIAAALATAGSNTARGVLADALARIGTDNAIQELCTEAVKAPDEKARLTIASAFRALSRPAAVPMLASLFSEVESGSLITEASGALRRLTDEAGVHALADLSQEGGQLYAQRENIFRVLSTVENPDALQALEVLAADTTDPERARAAAAGAAHLREITAEREGKR